MKKRLDANCSNYKVINEIVVCDSTKQCEKYKEFIKMQKKIRWFSSQIKKEKWWAYSNDRW